VQKTTQTTLHLAVFHRLLLFGSISQMRFVQFCFVPQKAISRVAASCGRASKVDKLFPLQRVTVQATLSTEICSFPKSNP
jgi:hypothetical protein